MRVTIKFPDGSIGTKATKKEHANAAVFGKSAIEGKFIILTFHNTLELAEKHASDYSNPNLSEIQAIRLTYANKSYRSS